MQFTSVAVVAALAATVAAWPSNNTVAYVTETVTALTTYCPAATTLTHNGVTYTVTEATTLTITNCPCTVVKPVTTSSVVYCNTCTTAPVYANTTTAVKTSVGTTSVKTTSTPTPSTITTSSSNKLFAMSGASLAGLVGLAAYLL